MHFNAKKRLSLKAESVISTEELVRSKSRVIAGSKQKLDG
ncbi:hypothetical protein KIS4809_5012 [Bacillus sp. ZZV12-4809]|nr:hypothetical protein KIS4809_5012 [Bacillus sp. ZZV12-4809]